LCGRGFAFPRIFLSSFKRLFLRHRVSCPIKLHVGFRTLGVFVTCPLAPHTYDRFDES
jgi:hypothetical protein